MTSRRLTPPPKHSYFSLLFVFHREGGVGSVPSQIPLPPPPALIPTPRPRTVSFLQRGARRRGQAHRHPAARSHVRALIPGGREEERRLGIDSELSVEPLCVCVCVLRSCLSPPPHLSHPPLLGASCPASSVPR